MGSSMLRRLGFFALIVFAGLAGAQAPRRQLSAAQAQQLEAALQSNGAVQTTLADSQGTSAFLTARGL